MKRLAMLAALLICGCDKTPGPATSGTSARKPPRSMDEAIGFMSSDIPIVPAAGNQGDYLIGGEGVWLLRGTEAVRVREVEHFSTTAPWVPTSQQSFNVHKTVDHNNGD